MARKLPEYQLDMLLELARDKMFSCTGKETSITKQMQPKHAEEGRGRLRLAHKNAQEHNTASGQ